MVTITPPLVTPATGSVSRFSSAIVVDVVVVGAKVLVVVAIVVVLGSVETASPTGPVEQAAKTRARTTGTKRTAPAYGKGRPRERGVAPFKGLGSGG